MLVICDVIGNPNHAFNPFLDQRNLGMSMKVERSSVDQVKKRFELLKKKKEEKTKEYDLSERIQELKEEVNERIITTLIWNGN